MTRIRTLVRRGYGLDRVKDEVCILGIKDHTVLRFGHVIILSILWGSDNMSGLLKCACLRFIVNASVYEIFAHFMYKAKKILY